MGAQSRTRRTQSPMVRNRNGSSPNNLAFARAKGRNDSGAPTDSGVLTSEFSMTRALYPGTGRLRF